MLKAELEKRLAELEAANADLSRKQDEFAEWLKGRRAMLLADYQAVGGALQQIDAELEHLAGVDPQEQEA